MKEHIIRAILYEDMSVKWKDEKQLRDSVNVHLNVHQKARQFVEVELGDFLLVDGEAIFASFEFVKDRETYHVNPSCMNKVEGEQRVFRLQIPTLVHNTPGEWEVQFTLVTTYDSIKGTYQFGYSFKSVKFSEHSSIIDDGLDVPTGENFSAVWNEVNSRAKEAATSASEAAEAKDAAEEARDQIQNNLETLESRVKAVEEKACEDTQARTSITALSERVKAVENKEGVNVGFYFHNVRGFYYNPSDGKLYSFYLSIYTNSGTEFTFDTLYDYLKNVDALSAAGFYREAAGETLYGIHRLGIGYENALRVVCNGVNELGEILFFFITKEELSGAFEIQDEVIYIQCVRQGSDGDSSVEDEKPTAITGYTLSQLKNKKLNEL